MSNERGDIQTIGIIAAILIGVVGIVISGYQEYRDRNASVVELSVGAVTATLTREVHELHAANPNTGTTEPLWEWYADRTLTFDIEIKNIRRRTVSVSKVLVYNDSGEEIGKKVFFGDAGRVLQAGNIIVSTIILDRNRFDSKLTAMFCSRVSDDATSCEQQDGARFEGKIVVFPVGGNESSATFELTTVNSNINGVQCVVEDLQRDVEPSEGCPIPEVALEGLPAR